MKSHLLVLVASLKLSLAVLAALPGNASAADSVLSGTGEDNRRQLESKAGHSVRVNYQFITPRHELAQGITEVTSHPEFDLETSSGKSSLTRDSERRD